MYSVTCSLVNVHGGLMYHMTSFMVAMGHSLEVKVTSISLACNHWAQSNKLMLLLMTCLGLCLA
jgi:hypothetical protein